MIEPIDKEEFMRDFKGRKSLSPETKVVIQLQPMTGLKFPCRWNHTGKRRNKKGNPVQICSSAQMLRAAVKRNGFNISHRCRNKLVMVWRFE